MEGTTNYYLYKHSSGGVVVVVPCCATLCTGYDCTVVYLLLLQVASTVCHVPCATKCFLLLTVGFGAILH
jgi:hypothetical protein